tara:strand:- start:59 stop:433 length:375 start_codon:yes stop_codon:yes gene_type:complete
MESKNEHVLQALRGANTCEKNTSKSIANAVKELVSELQERNKLKPEQILSITFSVTKDLDACFPASIARHQLGLGNVALLDCQQMYVKNDLRNCIRILAFAWLAADQKPNHPYLGKAMMLRPDR